MTKDEGPRIMKHDWRTSVCERDGNGTSITFWSYETGWSGGILQKRRKFAELEVFFQRGSTPYMVEKPMNIAYIFN